MILDFASVKTTHLIDVLITIVRVKDPLLFVSVLKIIHILLLIQMNTSLIMRMNLNARKTILAQLNQKKKIYFIKYV